MQYSYVNSAGNKLCKNIFLRFAGRASQYIYLVINQIDAQN